MRLLGRGGEPPLRDLEDRLKVLVGSSANVEPAYGGLEIHVRDYAVFPWGPVMDLLSEARQDVSVEREGDNFLIVAKPPRV